MCDQKPSCDPRALKLLIPTNLILDINSLNEKNDVRYHQYIEEMCDIHCEHRLYKTLSISVRGAEEDQKNTPHE